MTTSDDSLLATDTPHAVSVSELTGHVKAILEGTFPSIWVCGEVSDLVRARSGHLYFTLKDSQAQIRGIIWRTTAQRMKQPIDEGQSVLCFGDVEVYAARGTYQLVVRKVQSQGLGPLQLKFEKLKSQLHSEGLFAAERKRRLPKFPQRIGVITSPSGAAVRDFVKAASARLRASELLVIPALVQGEGSARSVAKAIDLAQQYSPALDVLVLARGGGSLEDLWTFNEEQVVRAVADCAIPTVSAIGHEIDVSLCDLAADVRALTPTDAASVVLPDANLITQVSRDLQVRLARAGRSLITTRREELEQLLSRPALRRPFEMLQSRSRELDELDARARRAMNSSLQIRRAELATTAAALSALSPLDVLTRGYSVTMNTAGRVVADAQQLAAGDVIQTRLHRGTVRSVVQETD